MNCPLRFEELSSEHQSILYTKELIESWWSNLDPTQRATAIGNSIKYHKARIDELRFIGISTSALKVHV